MLHLCIPKRMLRYHAAPDAMDIRRAITIIQQFHQAREALDDVIRRERAIRALMRGAPAHARHTSLRDVSNEHRKCSSRWNYWRERHKALARDYPEMHNHAIGRMLLDNGNPANPQVTATGNKSE